MKETRIRLDRYVSHASGMTRREAHNAIRRGNVTVNNEVIKDAGFQVSTSSEVAVFGESLSAPGKRYFMVNKPLGYICATEDARHPTVIELLDAVHVDRLHIAGRLDVDTTGLVLVSDDGDWSHRIMSPKHECPKTYRASLAEPLTPAAVEQLQNGVQLQGEDQPCRPAKIETLTPTEVRITITEGKYHQVKRMFAAVGNHVETLHRESIGALVLDSDLDLGESRALTTEEIALF